MDTNHHFSKQLVRLRARRGLSQNALARLAGLNQAHVLRLESEEILNPSIVTLRKLAKALGVPVQQLIGT